MKISNIKKMVFKTILLLAIIMQAVVLHAQVIDLTLNLPTSRSLSSLNDLKDLAENEINVVMKNLTDQPQTFTVELVMFSDETNFRIVTDPTRGVEIDLDGDRAERSIFYEELKQLFYEESLLIQYNGANNGKTVKQFLLDDPLGQIPAGQYQLCVRLRPTTLNQQLTNSLSNTSCAFLNFEHYTAPLVTTIKGEPCQFGCEFEELPNPNEQIIVNFTASEFNNVSGFNYQMKIFEVTSGDFNQDFSAMQGSIEPNRYLYDQPVLGFVSGNTIVEPIAIENIVGEFELGKQYALVVQAKAITGELLPIDGFSQIVPFHFGEITKDLPNSIDPNLPCQCSADCQTPDDLPTSTDGNSVNSLSKDDKVLIGCFVVTINENINKQDGKFSGTGTVSLPYLAAKFLVALKNLEVREIGTKLVAVNGKAIGLNNNQASPMAKAAYQAFLKTKGFILQTSNAATNGIADANALVQTSGDAINGGVGEVVGNMEEAKFPPEVMEAIYREQGVINENVEHVTQLGNDITSGAIYVNNTINSAANTAQSIFETGMHFERFAEQVINEDFVTGLPIGLKMGSGDEELRAGVFGMVFTPERASIDILLETPLIPAIDNRLYFGANNIAITASDFSISNATFYLGGNIIAGLPGGHSIRIKGTGTDGESKSGTFLKLEEGNFKEIQLQGDFIFSKEMFMPVSGSGNVVASLFAEAKNSFDDLLFTATTNSKFRMASNKMFEFTLRELSLDFSSSSNAELNSEKPNIWTGIFLKELALVLPSDFKIGTGNDRIEAKIQNLTIPFSETTLSFDAKVNNLLSMDTDGGKLGIFGFSIDTLYAKVTNNILEDIGFKGEIKVGLFDSNIPYDIDLKEIYESGKDNYTGNLPPVALVFRIQNDTKLEISAMHTSFTIGASSNISYNSEGHVINGVREAGRNLQFTLHGTISVESSEDGVKLPEMQFTDFFFDGRNIDTDRFNIKYASPQKFLGAINKDGKAGGFPISLTGFHPIFKMENGKPRFGLGFDVILNLMEKAGFGLTTGIELSVGLNESLVPDATSFNFAFNKISIQADVSIAKISGELEFKNDETWGNAFRGCIRIEMMKPAPIVGQVQGIFGSKGTGNDAFRYFFVEGLIQGINVLIPSTPIALDGFAGGLWYNMKENREQNTAARLNGPSTGCQAPNLVPEKEKMGIYFGVMFKEAASQGFAFNGMMLFKATLTTDFEPKTIAIEGAANFVKMPKTPADNSMRVAGELKLQYDFEEDVFSGELDVYLNVGGVLRGREENDLAGRMVMYFGHDDWYIFLGNPWGHVNDPGDKFTTGEQEYIGIKMGIKDIGEINAGMYFCMGTWGITGLPPLPEDFDLPTDGNIARTLSGNRQQVSINNSQGGIAFGAFASLNFSESIGSASAEASLGFGFDLALIQYSEGISCEGSNGTLGINGAYARGQIYGFASAKLSFRIPDFILDILYDAPDVLVPEVLENESIDKNLDKRHDIVLGELLAKADFGGPNPYWFDGELIIDQNLIETLVSAGLGVATGGVYTVIDAAAYALDESIDTKWGFGEDRVTSLTTDIVELLFDDGIHIKIQRGDRCTPDNTTNPTNRAQNNAINDRMGSNSIVSYISPMVGNGNIRTMELNEPIKVILNKPIEQEWSVSIKLSNGNTAVRRRRWKIYREDLSIKLHGNRKSISFTKSIVSPTEINYYLNNPSQIVTDPDYKKVDFVFSLIMQQFDDEENRFKDYPSFMDKPGTNEERSTIDEHYAAFEIKKEDIAINPSEVARTYPINNQRYYLRENASYGFIELSTKSMGLASNKFDLTRKLIVNGELVNEVPFSYEDIAGLTSRAVISYPIPALTLDSDVKIEFYAKRKAPVVQPGQENEPPTDDRPGMDPNDQFREIFTSEDYLPKRIYSLNFHTSKFVTFNEKVATATNPTFFHENEDNLEMKAIFRTSEPFEDFEKEFIVVKEIPLTTQWHLNNFDKCSGNILTINQDAALPNQSISPVLRDLVCQIVIETETARPFIMFENGFLSIEFAENENIYNAINNLPGNSTKPTEGDYGVQFYYETPVSTFTSPLILKTEIKTSDTKLNVAGQLSSGQSSRNELNKIDLNRTSGKFNIHYPGFAETIARQEASKQMLFNLLNGEKSKIQDKK